MLIKWNKSINKIILIFLTFIFFSISIFSFIQVQRLNRKIEMEKLKLGETYIDFDINNIINKFTKYRSDEFINRRYFTNEIKLKKENDKRISEDSIKEIKENIRQRKLYLTKYNNPTKEMLAEEIKSLEEEEKERIEEVNSKLNKTDEQYKQEIIQMEIDDKVSIEKRIKSIDNYKYFIVDNKTGEFETNSSYNKSDVGEKFYIDSNYAVKLSSDDKTSVDYNEYVGGKNVNSSDSNLYNAKQWIKGKDVTLYLWQPIDLVKNSDFNKSHTHYRISTIVGSVLFFINLILLWIMRNKVEIKYGIYNKIPIDLFLLGFLPICFLYALKSGLFYIIGMFGGYDTLYLKEYLFIGGAGVIGTIIVTYIEYVRTQSFKEVWKKAVLVEVIKDIKTSLEIRNVLFKVAMIFVLMLLEIAFVGSSYFMFGDMWPVVPVVLSIFDLILFFIIFKKLIYFNKILTGTEKISSGDLTLVLEEKNKGNLSKLAHGINNMKVGLKNSLEKEMKSERMKSELITNVSHDLKTPLTSIMNYVDLLKKETLTPEKANDYVAILDRKSKRLKNLVEDLFEASKAASGSIELNIEKIEITELMKQTLAEVEEKIAESTLDFKVNLGKEKVYSMVDGKRTYRVFENLVQNTLKYSMKHSRVYINLVQEEGTTKFIIKNISSYEMNFDADEIAERFKRGDVSRGTEGSGLGLAIAKSIMELQGGELKLEVDGDLFKASIIFKE